MHPTIIQFKTDWIRVEITTVQDGFIFVDIGHCITTTCTNTTDMLSMTDSQVKFKPRQDSQVKFIDNLGVKS